MIPQGVASWLLVWELLLLLLLLLMRHLCGLRHPWEQELEQPWSCLGMVKGTRLDSVKFLVQQ